MSWREWIDRHRRHQPPPSVELPASIDAPPESWPILGIVFDTENWQRESATGEAMSWSAPNARLRLTVTDNSVDGAPRTLTMWRAYHRTAARTHGEDIIEVESATVGAGTGLIVLTKQRSGRAANYIGRLEIHQGTRHFIITSEFDEGPRTGTRDAAVSAAVVATCGLDLEDPKPDGSRTIRGFFQDAYDPAFDDGALNSYTDDRRVDAILPDHPLSLLRRWMGRLENSLRLADGPSAASLVIDETPPAARGPRQLLRSETLWHLYEAAGRNDLLKTVLEAEIASLGEEPTQRLALCSLYLGCIENKMGRFLDALRPLRKAEASYRAIGQDDTPGMTETRTHLGWALKQLGRDADALSQLREALRLLRSHPNERLELLATSEAAVILAVHGGAGAREESQEYLQRAQALLAKLQRRQ